MAKLTILDAVKSYYYFNKNYKRTMIESSANKKPSLFKNLIVKAVGFIKRSSSNYYRKEITEYPEYDFEEIRIAKETDSYIKITHDKTKRLIYKAGYYFRSTNPECVKYLKTRFRIMSYAMQKPIDILFQEIADDLVDYSNCILVKNRVDSITKDGSVKAKSQLADKVVGGYTKLDLSTIAIKRDSYGNITKYIQSVPGEDDIEYNPIDIIHIYMDKDSSNLFGTPSVIAALEDVKLLRSLEGNVLALVHRFAMPIFHIKVGIPEVGMQATQGDIDKVQNEVETMAVEGTLITNEKTDIKVVGAEGSAIDASAYLQYFENRVIAALDSSASQMGRGGAKQDADSMEGQAHDKVKYIQKVIAVFVENYIINEILLEGGFNPILNENDVVNYVFNEINIESKIKVENHEMLKFQSGLQDRNETRKNIGYKEDIDDSQTYENIVDVPAKIAILKATYEYQGEMNMELAKFNAEAAEKQAEINAKTAEKQAEISAKASSQQNTNSSSNSSNAGKKVSGNTSNGKTQTSKQSGAVKSKNQPQNQYGTTSAKVKENLSVEERIIRDKQKHIDHYRNIYDRIDTLKNDLLIDDEFSIDNKFDNAYVDIVQNLNPFIDRTLKSALTKAKKDAEKLNKDTSSFDNMITNTDELQKLLCTSIKDILNDIENDIKKEEILTKTSIENIFNKNIYRIRFSLEYVLPKMYWYTYAFYGRYVGIKEAQVIFGNSDDKDNHDEFVSLLNIKYDDIPPFHPFCDCKLKYVEKEGE